MDPPTLDSRQSDSDCDKKDELTDTKENMNGSSHGKDEGLGSMITVQTTDTEGSYLVVPATSSAPNDNDLDHKAVDLCDPEKGTRDPDGACQSESEVTNNERPRPVNKAWTNMTEQYFHRWIRHVNVKLGVMAARRPKACLAIVTFISFALVAVGFLTNFEIVFSHTAIFTPLNSRPAQHNEWLYDKSGFNSYAADFNFLIHADGEDIMNVDAMRRVFTALDTVKNMPGYGELCAQSGYKNMKNEHDCWIWSPTTFWNDNVTEYEHTVFSDMDIQRILSQPKFPDGTPVFQESLFGKFQSTNVTSIYSAVADKVFDYELDEDYLTYIPVFFVTIGLPEVDAVWEFQEKLLEVFQDLRLSWQDQDLESNPHNLQLEFFCEYAYELEYARALTRDFPLVPVVFFVMLGFTCFVFHRYGKVQPGAPTRATIGFAAVVTVGVSLMSGFGLMFCVGVPFTNITLMAPFIILGIGLDDTFIITGAYFRRLREELELQDREGSPSTDLKNHTSVTMKAELLANESDSSDDENQNRKGLTEAQQVTLVFDRVYDHDIIVERIRSTLNEVGMSISMTTMTTTTAFVLGCISTIPGIRWLCLYCSVTIIFVFIYQVTYFVALLTLDERRVIYGQTKAEIKMDQAEDASVSKLVSYADNLMYNLSPLFPKKQTIEEDGDEDSANESNTVFIDRFMRWYARKLVTPRVRNTVLFLCMVLFAVCVYSTTQLTQRFDPQDYVPDDSYTQGFFNGLDSYAALLFSMAVYFRDIDQSDPAVHQQMRDYINEIAALPAVGSLPDYCWITDMGDFLDGNIAIEDLDLSSEQSDDALIIMAAIQNGNFTFEDKLDMVLNIPHIRTVYDEDIVRNDKGEILASRCFLYLREIDLDDTKAQVDLLYDERAITQVQPVNQLPEHLHEWAFFTHSSLHGYWELYAVAVDELIFTTIFGVVAVCAVGFIMIPHYSAIFFVGPLIVMLYFDLLGVMQFCGVKINAVTYVTIVISIGLLVDFLMHILLRYYETPGSTREIKVVKTLETMGASMMLGGFTTFLGVIPMAFCTTAIFMTIFVAFLSMVTLGLLIGLAFLPALLSICGPVVCVAGNEQNCALRYAGRDSKEQGYEPHCKVPPIEKSEWRPGKMVMEAFDVENEPYDENDEADQMPHFQQQSDNDGVHSSLSPLPQGASSSDNVSSVVKTTASAEQQNLQLLSFGSNPSFEECRTKDAEAIQAGVVPTFAELPPGMLPPKRQSEATCIHGKVPENSSSIFRNQFLSVRDGSPLETERKELGSSLASRSRDSFVSTLDSNEIFRSQSLPMSHESLRSAGFHAADGSEGITELLQEGFVNFTKSEGTFVSADSKELPSLALPEGGSDGLVSSCDPEQQISPSFILQPDSTASDMLRETDVPKSNTFVNLQNSLAAAAAAEILFKRKGDDLSVANEEDAPETNPNSTPEATTNQISSVFNWWENTVGPANSSSSDEEQIESLHLNDEHDHDKGFRINEALNSDPLLPSSSTSDDLLALS